MVIPVLFTQPPPFPFNASSTLCLFENFQDKTATEHVRFIGLGFALADLAGVAESIAVGPEAVYVAESREDPALGTMLVLQVCRRCWAIRYTAVVCVCVCV